MEQQQDSNKTTTKQEGGIKYENGKIYKIVGGDEHYIGSTTQRYVSQRFSQHVTMYHRYKKTGKGFVSSFILFDKYGLDCCSIELLEHYSCESKRALEKKEFSYIQMSPCVNKQKQQQNIKRTTRKQQEIKCEYCSTFKCNLKSDYNRHIESDYHIKNKTIHDIMGSLHHTDMTFIRHAHLFKKMHHQFNDRTAFPRHKFESRHLMVDIRDMFSPTNDRECSFSN